MGVAVESWLEGDVWLGSVDDAVLLARVVPGEVGTAPEVRKY